MNDLAMVVSGSLAIETLSEFIEWASQFNDGQYLFRGVPNDCYKIEASALRRLPEVEKNNPTRFSQINQELIAKAKSQGHDQKNGQRLSDLELLAELQHFGAATCLIDFSRNALVALWFACQPNSTEAEENGKVFAVRCDDTDIFKIVTPDLIDKDLDYFFKPNESREPLYQWQPKLQNNRIIAQQSVFLFGAAQIDAVNECIILKSSKKDLLVSLDTLSGVTEASLFPDFDGFARLHAHNQPYIEPNARGYLQRGIEAYQRGDSDAAITYCKQVMSFSPLPEPLIIGRAYYTIGEAYRAKGECDRAIENYTKAIEWGPKSVGSRNNRGIAYSLKGEYDCAIKDYTKAIELNPDLAIPYNNRGIAYSLKGEYDCAIKDYTKAIELNPAYATVYNNRGKTWLHLEEWKKAKSDLTTAEEKGINIVNAFCNVYESVADFQRKTGITLPEDVAEMLTPT